MNAEVNFCIDLQFFFSKSSSFLICVKIAKVKFDLVSYTIDRIMYATATKKTLKYVTANGRH